MIVVAATSSPIGFAPVKALLAALEVSAEDANTDVGKSMRILHPLDSELASKVRAGASLTDAATPDEQIRFFQSQRATRSFVKLADHIKDMFPDIAVTVSSSHLLDAGSKTFFDVAARVSGWIVTYCPAALSEAVVYQADQNELRILDYFSPSAQAMDVERLQDAAFEYINVGDAWTAKKLGEKLRASNSSPRTWNLLALAHAMLGETLEAEFHYRRWEESGTDLDRVRALYGISMLYARHHPIGLLSIDRSAELLEEAYEIIVNLQPVERSDESVVFDEVFNRNGFALTLFRRGDVDGATEMLRWGIRTLEGTTEKVSIHRTVLIYNLAQCLKQSGNLLEAIKTYEHLTAVDPYMPEYYLEFAKTLATAGEQEAALDACKRALELDDTIAAGWALQGVYQNQKGQHDEAVNSLGEANRLQPDSVDYALDLSYVLALTGSYEAALAVLDNLNPEAMGEAEAERHISLRAEALLNLGLTEKAITILQEGVESYPDSETLQKNHALVSGQYS